MGQLNSRYSLCYPVDMTTIERLRSMRKRARLTQLQLAERLGVAQSWVSDRERGRRHVLVDDLLDWSEACGVPVAVIELPGHAPEAFGELLRSLPSSDYELAVAFLHALPFSSDETRSTLAAILRLSLERAKDQHGSQQIG